RKKRHNQGRSTTHELPHPAGYPRRRHLHQQRAPLGAPCGPGGGDDGKDGRLRVKGVLPGPLEAPQTGSERAALSEQAEQVGLPEEATSD
ncbi:hypothetical protein J4N16_11430, partial [Cutibacterium acnes]|nr:hypothetical protein [Cutibacterium acnes]